MILKGSRGNLSDIEQRTILFNAFLVAWQISYKYTQQAIVQASIIQQVIIFMTKKKSSQTQTYQRIATRIENQVVVEVEDAAEAVEETIVIEVEDGAEAVVAEETDKIKKMYQFNFLIVLFGKYEI